MKKQKKIILSADKTTVDESKNRERETRRNFLKKYGALATITPVAMSLTMHSKKALASSVVYDDAW